MASRSKQNCSLHKDLLTGLLLLGQLAVSLSAPMQPPRVHRSGEDAQEEVSLKQPFLSWSMVVGAHTTFYYSSNSNSTLQPQHKKLSLNEHQTSLFESSCDLLFLYISLTAHDDAATSDLHMLLEKNIEDNCLWYRALRSRIMSSSDAGTSATSSQGTMTAMEGNHVQGDGSGEDNSCSSEDLEEFRRQCLDFSLRRITRNVLGKTRQFCAPTHCGGSIDTCQWLDQTFDDNELNSRVKPVMPKYLCRELLV